MSLLTNIAWILLTVTVIAFLLLVIGFIVCITIIGIRVFVKELRGNNEADNL